MKISLVIPCYNEARNLPALLERCSRLTAPHPIEVVLVNNGSSDDSAAVLEALLPSYPGCRMVTVPKNEGYGFGILSGLRAASGDILAWTHADMQTDPADVARGAAFFSDNRDVFVKGRRFGRPLIDRAFTAGMSFFESLLFRRRLIDVNAQPTMFSRAFFESWSNPPHDFSLDLFAYVMAAQANLAVRRFPVHFGPRAFGASSWNTGIKARYRFIKRTLSYSAALKKGLER